MSPGGTKHAGRRLHHLNLFIFFFLKINHLSVLSSLFPCYYPSLFLSSLVQHGGPFQTAPAAGGARSRERRKCKSISRSICLSHVDARAARRPAATRALWCPRLATCRLAIWKALAAPDFLVPVRNAGSTWNRCNLCAMCLQLLPHPPASYLHQPPLPPAREGERAASWWSTRRALLEGDREEEGRRERSRSLLSAFRIIATCAYFFRCSLLSFLLMWKNVLYYLIY